MNGYGTGTINQVYRPLGLGTIKASDGVIVLFLASAVRNGAEAFQRLAEGDKVKFRLFADEIAGVRFASDVWQ
jgi:cold shock CspA family protein